MSNFSFLLGPYIQGCIQAIRKEVRSATKEVKAMAVLKLAYLQMLGYEMGWAAPDVVEVMSYAKLVNMHSDFIF